MRLIRHRAMKNLLLLLVSIAVRRLAGQRALPDQGRPVPHLGISNVRRAVARMVHARWPERWSMTGLRGWKSSANVFGEPVGVSSWCSSLVLVLETGATERGRGRARGRRTKLGLISPRRSDTRQVYDCGIEVEPSVGYGPATDELEIDS
jgi:hypothetical protein